MFSSHAVGKAGKGTLREHGPDDLAAIPHNSGSDSRVPGLDPKDKREDVILMAGACHEGEAGNNLARIAPDERACLLKFRPSHQPVLLLGTTVDRHGG